MIDSHCHFDHEVFKDQYLTLWQSCLDQHFTHLIIPSTRVDTNAWAMELSRSLSGVYFASGLHPAFIEGFFDVHGDRAISTLELMIYEQSMNAHCVAIGEVGVDAAVNVCMERQLACLQLQMRLASELELPLILHHRKSHHLILPLLKKQKGLSGGVIHGFSGSLQQAQEYWSLGFYLGVGGVISYPRAKKTRSTIASMPLQSLLLETDAPFMPVCGYQGRANSPLQLSVIADALADLKGMDVEDVVRQTDANCYALFKGLKNDHL